ncbi:MAG: PHA/PHB synthase family protein [Candidatus Binataceae bacterium]
MATAMKAEVRPLNPELKPANPEESAPSLDAVLGGNPFVDFDLRQMAGTIGEFTLSLAARPDVLVSTLAALGRELFKIGLGSSVLAPEPADKRFIDPTWNENPVYRHLLQAYLAWRNAMHDLVADGRSDGQAWKLSAQHRFAVMQLTEALAPTNLLLSNPAALKRAFETGGRSLVAGMLNLIDDLIHNGGMPSQVDKRPFEVGRNLAATPGAVVYRSELCEVIQFKSAAAQVYERPVVLVPPQINKYYVMDLAPKRSLIEYGLARGIQFFAVSWRNPGVAQRDWGLDDYVRAAGEAVDVAGKVAGSADVNLLGVCAGGITSSLLLGHLATANEHKVNAATLLVTMLDSSHPSMAGMFATEDAVCAALKRSHEKGVLDAASMSRLFAWLRPNDLVWHYWVNNYLMGKEPAAFDILFWNADSTNLTAALHAGFLDLLMRNPLAEHQPVKILGTSIDLRQVACDMYIVAGLTDHICSWRACHHAARLFGGTTEFVLNSSGHVQTLVCPPDNPKAKYFTNPRLGDDPAAWLREAQEHKGSWWENWLTWLERRSGEKRAAPESLGSGEFPILTSAPGTYVHQRPS